MKRLCECNSMNCQESFEASFNELKKIQIQGHITIATNCSHGPEPTDELVSENETYRVFKP